MSSYIPEMMYMRIMSETLRNGRLYEDRTGVGCYKTFDHVIKWGSAFPFSTYRPLGIKGAWEEMKLFLSGKTNTKSLEEKGINFWKEHTSRAFLDSRGLYELYEGDLGTSYSHQFRNAGGSLTWHGNGIDQVNNLIDGLQFEPFSRRHAIDLWCVPEQPQMVLLPCWYRSSWYCTKEDDNSITLNLKLHNRSLDILFGYFQAAMQYKLFQIALCKMLGYNVGNLTTDHIDCHIYTNQVDYVEELLTRRSGVSGSVSLHKEINSLADIINLEHTDFTVEGYVPNNSPFVTPRPPIAI